jgi:cystathionine beta-lyase
MFDFDKKINRADSDSIKWAKYRGRPIIPMWVADMDFESPPSVMAALQERVRHGVFGYASPDEQQRSIVVDHLQQQFQWSISPQWIVWLPGVVTGLNVACRSTAAAGDRIVTTVPVYPPILSAPKYWTCRLGTTRMVNDANAWQIDFDDLEAAMDPQTRLFILCNPHNPTGRVFRKTELERLAELCESRDIVICSDEIHCDLVLEPGLRHIPFATLGPEVSRRTITLMAPSKTYNIPGLGCSFAVIESHDLRKRFLHAMRGIVPHPNILGITAACAAYQSGRAWLDALLDYLRLNRDLVCRRIGRMPGLNMSPGDATYLAWIDAGDLGLSNPCRFFENAGVGLSDGSEFDGDGFVRLNFGCTRSLLEQALDRMAKAIEKASE